MYHRSGTVVKNICLAKALYYRRFLFHRHLNRKSVMQRTGEREVTPNPPNLEENAAEMLCS